MKRGLDVMASMALPERMEWLRHRDIYLNPPGSDPDERLHYSVNALWEMRNIEKRVEDRIRVAP